MNQPSTRTQLLGSLKIALVVGCILSAINQYDVILAGAVGTKESVKIFLNFLVPFLVASYSKYQFRKHG